MISRHIKATALTLAITAALGACSKQDDPDLRNEGQIGLTEPAPATPPLAGNDSTMPQPQGRVGQDTGLLPDDERPVDPSRNGITTEPHAVAQMRPTAGHEASGLISFLESPDGEPGIRVLAQMSGLEPGPHGFHIHETGDCSAPDASSAGAHFNPDAMPHGNRTDAQRHVGDLGNVTADATGIVTLDLVDQEISFAGDDSILNKAVVVHAGNDDYTTQPSGNSGAPEACGVITLAETSPLPPNEQPTTSPR